MVYNSQMFNNTGSTNIFSQGQTQGNLFSQNNNANNATRSKVIFMQQREASHKIQATYLHKDKAKVSKGEEGTFLLKVIKATNRARDCSTKEIKRVRIFLVNREIRAGKIRLTSKEIKIYLVKATKGTSKVIYSIKAIKEEFSIKIKIHSKVTYLTNKISKAIVYSQDRTICLKISI